MTGVHTFSINHWDLLVQQNCPLHRGVVCWVKRLPLPLTLPSCTSALAPTSQQMHKCFSAMQTRGFWSAQRCCFMRGGYKSSVLNLQTFTYVFVKKRVFVFPGFCLCVAFLNYLSKSYRFEYFPPRTSLYYCCFPSGGYFSSNSSLESTWRLTEILSISDCWWLENE